MEALRHPILRKPDLPLKPVAIADWKNGVLLRATNWLGDVMMTLPAAYKLKKLLPKDCKLFVLSRLELSPIWDACPWVDEVIGMSGKRIGIGEIECIKACAPGVAVVFPNSLGAALDVWRCHIPVRIGREGRLRSWLLTHRLPEWKRGEGVGQFHQLSFYLELVSALGALSWDTQCPPLQVDAQLAADLGVADGPWVALAPGAAFGPAKQWPGNHFMELAKRLKTAGLSIVLVGAAKERPVCDEIAQTTGALNLAGRTSLPQLMSVLAAARAVVANDSGAMHLAAALGTPGVAIFGSTDPVGTGPLGAPWHLCVSQEPCRPCFQRTCQRNGEDAYACLKRISPQDVWEALESVLHGKAAATNFTTHSNAIS
jgi:heptosyltransferase-2